MIEMTVTYEGLLRCKLIHWTKVIFLSTNNNRTDKDLILADFSVVTLCPHLIIIVGARMEKLGLDFLTKGCIALHNRNTETDSGIRFYS